MQFAAFSLTAVLLMVPLAARAADTPAAQINAVSDLASLLEGEFTTQPGPAEAAAASRAQRPPLYNLAKRVDVPGLGHNVVYAEMREGAPDGRLLRQRLYVLSPDPATNSSRILMTTYNLGNAPELAGTYANAAPLAKLNPPDLKPQPAGCEVVWHRTDTGFEGDVPGGRCAIEPQGGGSATTASAHLTVSKQGMTEGLTAAGTGGSGSSSPQGPTVFRRLR